MPTKEDTHAVASETVENESAQLEAPGSPAFRRLARGAFVLCAVGFLVAIVADVTNMGPLSHERRMGLVMAILGANIMLASVAASGIRGAFSSAPFQPMSPLARVFIFAIGVVSLANGLRFLFQ